MTTLTERHTSEILGTPSCFDRVAGALPDGCHAGAMAGHPTAQGIRLFGYPQRAFLHRGEFREHAGRQAHDSGLEFDFVRRKDFRREKLIQGIIAERRDHEGLVHILSAMEPRESFKPWRAKASGKSFVKSTEARCLHYYFYCFYFVDPALGLCYLRVPTWAPFRLQCYFNGHNALPKFQRSGMARTLIDNAFEGIAGFSEARELADALNIERLHRHPDRRVAAYGPVARHLRAGLHWSLMQVEYATDLVFRTPADFQSLYEALTHTAIHAINPEHIAAFLALPLTGAYQGEIGNDFPTSTLRAHHIGAAAIKLYDKLAGRARAECAASDVTFFERHLAVEHLDLADAFALAPVRRSTWVVLPDVSGQQRESKNRMNDARFPARSVSKGGAGYFYRIRRAPRRHERARLRLAAAVSVCFHMTLASLLAWPAGIPAGMASFDVFRTPRPAQLAGPGPVSGGQRPRPVPPALRPALPGLPFAESTIEVFPVPADLFRTRPAARPEPSVAVGTSAPLKTGSVSGSPSGGVAHEPSPGAAARQRVETTGSPDPPAVGTTESVVAEPVTPARTSPIIIIHPRDGDLIPPEAPPAVVVDGQVADDAASTIWLVVNEARIAVPIRDGRFRQLVPAAAPVLRLRAEVSPAGGPPRRSETVTVRTVAPRAASAILVIDWPPEARDLQMEVSAIWRPRPDLLDGPRHPLPMDAFGVSRDTSLPEVFSLTTPAPGVYTFVLSYRAQSAVGEARPTLFLQDHGSLDVRSLRPVFLAGAGRAVLARILLPQGVLWEHDRWFTGWSDSADTVTKFRFPEGISWIERRADP